MFSKTCVCILDWFFSHYLVTEGAYTEKNGLPLKLRATFSSSNIRSEQLFPAILSLLFPCALQCEMRGKRGPIKLLCILANAMTEMKFLILTLYNGAFNLNCNTPNALQCYYYLWSLKTWLTCLNIDWPLRFLQLPKISAESWKPSQNHRICWSGRDLQGIHLAMHRTILKSLTMCLRVLSNTSWTLSGFNFMTQLMGHLHPSWQENISWDTPGYPWVALDACRCVGS